MAKFHKVGAIKLTKSQDKLFINLQPELSKGGGVSFAGLQALYTQLGDLINNPSEDRNRHGVALQIEKPADKLTRLCSKGFIEEDELEDRIAKVPQWIKYEITFVENTDKNVG